MSKYHNEKTKIDGIVFDSKKEANRYRELSLLQKAGEIQGLKCQVKYLLIPAQMWHGIKAEREATYVADFQYFERAGKQWMLVVEDVKSSATRTREYILKRKLMLWVHGIRIREV